MNDRRAFKQRRTHILSRGRALLVWIWLLSGVMLVNARAFADEPIPVMELWSNVFAGEEISLLLPVESVDAVGKTVGWSAVLETAVLARRESVIRQDETSRQPVLPVKFQLPEGEPKTVLAVSVYVNSEGKDRLAKQLWIYPRDPFQQPIPHLKPDEFVLFDPPQKTAARWRELNLKFRLEKRMDAVASLPAGLLVVGEGTNYREFRGLSEMLMQLAARGVKVLCLAPSAGSLQFPGDEDVRPKDDSPSSRIMSFHLERANKLLQFDEHLDTLDWRNKFKSVATTLKLHPKAGHWNVELLQDSEGWAWLEAEFSSGGRIIVSGYQCVAAWDAGPAPRHAMWLILSHAARPSTTLKPLAIGVNQESRSDNMK